MKKAISELKLILTLRGHYKYWARFRKEETDPYILQVYLEACLKRRPQNA